MASERQINSLPGLLAVKIMRQQISLTNRPAHQSTTLTNKRRQCRTCAKHRRLKSGPPHMSGPPQCSLKSGPPHLTANKLVPVYPTAIVGPPKTSFLLEAKSILALIIKPRLILVMQHLGWYIASNKLGQMFIQNLNRIVSEPNVTPQTLFKLT